MRISVLVTTKIEINLKLNEQDLLSIYFLPGPIMHRSSSQVLRLLPSTVPISCQVTEFVYFVLVCPSSTTIIIIIIIKKGRQCKAEREWYTPYQFEDPSPTIRSYWQKEEKGKNSRRPYSSDRAAYANKKAWALLLKPASPTPSNTELARSFQRHTERGIKVLLYCDVLHRGGA